MAVVEDLAALPAALLEVKPTMLYTVPTLFKRVYDKIQDKITNEKVGGWVGGWLRRRRFERATVCLWCVG